jgi:hypothetical protein
LGRLREVRESIRVLGVHAEIRIGILPCTSQKRNRLSHLVGLKKKLIHSPGRVLGLVLLHTQCSLFDFMLLIRRS